MEINFQPLENFPYRSPLDICDAIKNIVKDKIVCDIGCGKGDLFEYLRIRKMCKEVKGIEKEPRRYVKQRDYIKFGNIFDVGIPDADIYFLWLGADFPYKKLLDKIKKEIIIINPSGINANHEKFQQISGIKLLQSITYEYDETKFIHENKMESYLKELKALHSQNSSWTIIGTRICKIYKYTPS